MSVMNKIDEVILTLVKYYLKGSLAFTLEIEDAKIMSWDNQQAFLDATIHNKLLQDYPVNNEFSKLFFKKLISCIEPYHEIHDDCYSFLCSVMKRENINNFCYRHYIIDNNIHNVITLMESNNMVVDGTTGMRTWEAALVLADWALRNKDVFANKKVLELGSGVGFTGITIAKKCEIDSIVLTDCHNEVLKTMKRNIEINFPVNSEGNALSKSILNIDAMMLDWNDNHNLQKKLVPDILIGADIVYDPTILKPLCNVIRNVFDANNRLQVYIASLIRNEETFACFLQALESNELNYMKLSQDRSFFIDWDYRNKQWCILKIMKK